MSDERDTDQKPAEELKRGLHHLWRAARGVAAEVKREVHRTDIGKVLDDAGKELARAATNVVDRISGEVTGHKPGATRGGAPAEPPHGTEGEGEKPAPTGGSDSGFRIAVDEDNSKKKPE